MFFRDLKTNCIFIYVLESNDLLNLKIKKWVLIYLFGNAFVIYDYDYVDCGRQGTLSIGGWTCAIAHRACGTCCVRCKCIPPSISSNKELGGTCYIDMITHNKTKYP